MSDSELEALVEAGRLTPDLDEPIRLVGLLRQGLISAGAMTSPPPPDMCYGLCPGSPQDTAVAPRCSRRLHA